MFSVFLLLATGRAANSALSTDWVADPTHVALVIGALIALLKIYGAHCYYRDLSTGREYKRQSDDLRLPRKPR